MAWTAASTPQHSGYSRQKYGQNQLAPPPPPPTPPLVTRPHHNNSKAFSKRTVSHISAVANLLQQILPSYLVSSLHKISSSGRRRHYSFYLTLSTYFYTMAMKTIMAITTGIFIILAISLANQLPPERDRKFTTVYNGTSVLGLRKYSSLDFSQRHYGNYSLHPPQKWHFPMGFMQTPFCDDIYNFSLTGKQCFNPVSDYIQNGKKYGSGSTFHFQQDRNQPVSSSICD